MLVTVKGRRQVAAMQRKTTRDANGRLKNRNYEAAPASKTPAASRVSIFCNDVASE